MTPEIHLSGIGDFFLPRVQKKEQSTRKRNSFVRVILTVPNFGYLNRRKNDLEGNSAPCQQKNLFEKRNTMIKWHTVLACAKLLAEILFLRSRYKFCSVS